MKRARYAALLLSILLVTGFDYTEHAIDPGDILSGGPKKDGIPSLTTPRFVKAQEASFLNDTDKVIGVVIGALAKAYPVYILSWHEAVNDEAEGVKFLVTW